MTCSPRGAPFGQLLLRNAILGHLNGQQPACFCDVREFDPPAGDTFNRFRPDGTDRQRSGSGALLPVNRLRHVCLKGYVPSAGSWYMSPSARSGKATRQSDSVMSNEHARIFPSLNFRLLVQHCCHSSGMERLPRVRPGNHAPTGLTGLRRLAPSSNSQSLRPLQIGRQNQMPFRQWPYQLYRPGRDRLPRSVVLADQI